MSITTVEITGTRANVESLPGTAEAVMRAISDRPELSLKVPEAHIKLIEESGDQGSIQDYLGKRPEVVLSSNLDVDFDKAIVDCQALGRELTAESVTLKLNGVELCVPVDSSIDELRQQYLDKVCDNSRNNLSSDLWGDRDMHILTACTVARITGQRCEFTFNGRPGFALHDESPEKARDRFATSR